MLLRCVTPAVSYIKIDEREIFLGQLFEQHNDMIRRLGLHADQIIDGGILKGLPRIKLLLVFQRSWLLWETQNLPLQTEFDDTVQQFRKAAKPLGYQIHEYGVKIME